MLHTCISTYCHKSISMYILSFCMLQVSLIFAWCYIPGIYQSVTVWCYTVYQHIPVWCYIYINYYNDIFHIESFISCISVAVYQLLYISPTELGLIEGCYKWLRAYIRCDIKIPCHNFYIKYLKKYQRNNLSLICHFCHDAVYTQIDINHQSLLKKAGSL